VGRKGWTAADDDEACGSDGRKGFRMGCATNRDDDDGSAIDCTCQAEEGSPETCDDKDGDRAPFVGGREDAQGEGDGWRCGSGQAEEDCV